MYHIPFIPRPFPPPLLADIPLEYIVAQLQRLAPEYWSSPETSDCTIVVSLDYASSEEKVQDSADVGDALGRLRIDPGTRARSFALEDGPSSAAGSLSRKSVRPRWMIMRLHMDYLCAHSALFRSLLSTASSSNVAMEAPTSVLAGLDPQSSCPQLRFPYILPSSTSSHPVIHLPVPDPASFHHVVHYIYFGSTFFMQEALDNGDLAFDGLARNVEYLKMGDKINLFLARYLHCDYSDSDCDCEYDSDYDLKDVCMAEDESMPAAPDEDHICLVDEEEDKDDMPVLKTKAGARAWNRDPHRSRQRATQRLGRSHSDSVIIPHAAESEHSDSL